VVAIQQLLSFCFRLQLHLQCGIAARIDVVIGICPRARICS
jgi:hypothetical protein